MQKSLDYRTESDKSS